MRVLVCRVVIVLDNLKIGGNVWQPLEEIIVLNHIWLKRLEFIKTIVAYCLSSDRMVVCLCCLRSLKRLRSWKFMYTKIILLYQYKTAVIMSLENRKVSIMSAIITSIVNIINLKRIKYKRFFRNKFVLLIVFTKNIF